MKEYFNETDLLHFQNQGFLVWEVTNPHAGDRHEFHVLDMAKKQVFFKKEDFDKWLKQKQDSKNKKNGKK